MQVGLQEGPALNIFLVAMVTDRISMNLHDIDVVICGRSKVQMESLARRGVKVSWSKSAWVQIRWIQVEQ